MGHVSFIIKCKQIYCQGHTPLTNINIMNIYMQNLIPLYLNVEVQACELVLLKSFFTYIWCRYAFLRDWRMSIFSHLTYTQNGECFDKYFKLNPSWNWEQLMNTHLCFTGEIVSWSQINCDQSCSTCNHPLQSAKTTRETSAARRFIDKNWVVSL